MLCNRFNEVVNKSSGCIINKKLLLFTNWQLSSVKSKIRWPLVAHWINLIRTAVFGSRQRIPNVPRQGFIPLDPECPRSFPTSGGPLPLPVGGRVTEEVISVDNAVSHTHPRPLTTPCLPLQDPRHRGFERGEGVLDTSCLTSRIDRV